MEEPVVRRVLPGTKTMDFFAWPDQRFDDMDGNLAVEQYIRQCIRQDFKDLDGMLEPPDGVDVNVWNYEHLRQFCNQLNDLCVLLQPVCNAETCSQMTATVSWIFLCAVHKEPKECCAIDYIRHTLDGAASILNSFKYFPSRQNIKETSVNKLPSTCRRVYRIFSHAFFHHKKIFWDFELRTMLCHRFTRWVRKYELITEDLLIIPLDDADDEMGDNNSDGDGYATLINTSVVEKKGEVLYETVSRQHPPPPEEDEEEEEERGDGEEREVHTMGRNVVALEDQGEEVEEEEEEDDTTIRA